jgi:DNA-binding LytR/AlgR family response regulator
MGGRVREPGANDGAGENPLVRIWRRVFAEDWLRILLAVGVVGVILAISGAFGNGGMSIAGRLAYWQALVFVGFVLGRIGGSIVVPRPWFETRPMVAACLMTLIIGLPMTLVTTFASAWVAGRPVSLARLLDVFPSTLATTAALVALAFMVQHRASAKTHLSPIGAPPPRFLARLPAKLAGANLWAVEAQDHYLRLHTSKGEDLILMRLADALVELEGIEGARTHRSWWVARDAVKGVERAEGRATLTLASGVEAPVSRAYVKTLREAGWF